MGSDLCGAEMGRDSYSGGCGGGSPPSIPRVLPLKAGLGQGKGRRETEKPA